MKCQIIRTIYCVIEEKIHIYLELTFFKRKSKTQKILSLNQRNFYLPGFKFKRNAICKS